MSKTSTIYNSLNEPQKQFVQTKKLEASYKVKAWLDLLKNIALLDKYGDLRRVRASGWALGLGIIAFVVLFFAFPFPLLFIVVIALTIISIILWVKSNNLKKIDLTNSFRLFTVPLLVVLKEEAKDDSKVELKLDMSDPLQKNYLVKNIPNTSKTYPKIELNYYNINWMQMSIELNDGVIVSSTFEDDICEKKATKQNARGKIKTKTKYKVKHDVSMKVQIPKALYNLVGATDSDYSDGGEYHIFKTKGRTVSTSMEEFLDINYFLGMIASVYKKVKQKT